MLSIIIPLSQDPGRNERTLRSLQPLPRAWEILMAGPFEEDLAKKYHARFVEAPRVRGLQKQYAALRAKGEWLLFLHPGTLLSTGWKEAVQRHMQQADAGPAQFIYKVEDESDNARQVEAFMAWRARNWAGSGMQGLLISKAHYEKTGGFKSWAVCEDMEYLRILKRQGTMTQLTADAIVPAETYTERGYMRTAFLKSFTLYLYLLKIPASVIARWCKAES